MKNLILFFIITILFCSFAATGNSKEYSYAGKSIDYFLKEVSIGTKDTLNIPVCLDGIAIVTFNGIKIKEVKRFLGDFQFILNEQKDLFFKTSDDVKNNKIKNKGNINTGLFIVFFDDGQKNVIRTISKKCVDNDGIILMDGENHPIMFKVNIKK